jgi:hypothetical protein
MPEGVGSVWGLVGRVAFETRHPGAFEEQRTLGCTSLPLNLSFEVPDKLGRRVAASLNSPKTGKQPIPSSQ